MVLLYSTLKGAGYNATPTGTITLQHNKISPDIFGELYLTAISAGKPEEPVPVRVRLIRREVDDNYFIAESPLLSVDGRIVTILESDYLHLQIRLKILNRGAAGAYSLAVRFRAPAKGEPRFMIPGIFYKHNRPEKCIRSYPAFSLNPERASDPYISNYWAFRSDRSSEPAVFAWQDDYHFALTTPASFDKGMSGLFFSADGETLEIGLNYPYSEEPLKYSPCSGTDVTPEHTFFHLKRNEEFSVTFDFAIGKRDLHFYAPFLRFLYERERKDMTTNPWVSADVARFLISEGLYRWHYDGEEGTLWETAAFDRYFGKKDGYFDRLCMHVSWLSGVPTAMALLWQGRLSKNDNYIYAAIRVLDKIASGIAPAGTFYPCWVSGRGWACGLDPTENRIQARTVAEATFFLLRAIRLECKYGQTHPNWVEALKKSLEFAVRIQREDGSFGSYYDIFKGEVTEWDGAAGLLWIAPLIGASVFFSEKRYRQAALKAGAYYARFIEDEFIYGAPEDAHLTPTSEDGYNALISYLLLGEIARDERWIHLARKAADWLLTFRFCYNLHLPPNTILSTYDFHTFGGDISSPLNQHLHFYGLVCHPELMRLGKHLEDNYYIERARENLEFCHQFIARADGDFGARMGMVPEQFYYTEWRQPAGHVTPLSHAWCAGLILYADLWEKETLGESTLRLEDKTHPALADTTTPIPITPTPAEEIPPSERDTIYDL